MHPEEERAVREVGTVHPLAVNLPVVIIVTSGRYALASMWSAVEFFVESRITLGVFQTKTGFVAFSYLFATIPTWQIYKKDNSKVRSHQCSWRLVQLRQVKEIGSGDVCTQARLVSPPKRMHREILLSPNILSKEQMNHVTPRL